LTFDEIEKALKARVPLDKTARSKLGHQRKLVPKQIVKTAKALEGTLEAVLLDKKMKKLNQLPVSELAEKLQGIKDVDTVVFDGVITQRLVDIAEKRNVNYLVAARISKAMKQPLQVKLLTFDEIKS
jgi:DNA primase